MSSKIRFERKGSNHTGRYLKVVYVNNCHAKITIELLLLKF